MSSTSAPLESDTVWPSLATVVPVYNEEAGIEQSLRAIVAVVARYSGRAIVIAVDDGSGDRSGAVLVDLERELDLLVMCRHKVNAGYGAALRTGAHKAAELGFDFVVFIDSDLTNPPDDILKIGELASRGHSYIKGSRFVTGGGMGSVPFRRQIFSEAGNAIGRTLFGTRLRDVTNGFRAVRTELFLSWPLRETRIPDHRRGAGLGPAGGRRAGGVPDRPDGTGGRTASLVVPVPSAGYPFVPPVSPACPGAASPTSDEEVHVNEPNRVKDVCRGCTKAAVRPFFDLGELPLAGGFLAQEQVASEQRYPLLISVCEHCGLVQIVSPVDPAILFQDYSFATGTIPGLVKHFDGYAQWISDTLGPKSVIEFGCNDGTLIAALEERGIRSLGVDLAANITEMAHEQGRNVLTGAFGPPMVDELREQMGQVDLVTGSNVFAHNADPVAILEAADSLLAPEGVLVWK